MPRRMRRESARRPMISDAATRALFGCACAVMAVGAWTAGAAAAHPGERLYEGYCRRCHGQEGRGTRAAPSLIPFDWSDEDALNLVRHPLCDMPPIPASTVSDDQVAQIVAYLKTIK